MYTKNRIFDCWIFTSEFLENSVLELGLFAGLLFTICFIFGCHTNTPTYMLSFILFQIVNLATSSISLILTIMLHVMGYHLIDTFILIFFMVLQSYYTIVIYNHYQNLREGIIS
ncbi:hypothetical protein O3M35_011750 [Rhynocoris fuscipes]|uniref:Uncharacterized protein n=1 Tax=Rhynocoris fuscipes TaxID=488301 RepID=A0AAW1CI02_9HEMI